MHWKSKWLKILTILLVCLLTLTLLFHKTAKAGFERFGCYIRIEVMGSVLNNHHLSNYTRWYDELMTYDNAADTFKCPASDQKGTIGTYLINKNYESIWDVRDKEIVLVFEGGDGWNQIGDANDILPVHGDGCYVLFTGGNIRFVKKEDFTKLVWENFQEN